MPNLSRFFGGSFHTSESINKGTASKLDIFMSPLIQKLLGVLAGHYFFLVTCDALTFMNMNSVIF
jgi:hypothetical protein